MLRMPFPEYLAIDAASKHGLELLLRSPAHYRWAQEQPSEASPAQALGTLAHTLILEPETASRYLCEQVDRRTNAGKARWAEIQAEGLTLVSPDQMEAAEGMRDAVMAHPLARVLFAAGEAEGTLLWDDEETGLACKARPDWWNGDHDLIVDLKTASDGSFDGFSRAAGAYGYHLQAAHYMDGAIACGMKPQAFLFVVVESAPPHAVAVYTMDDNTIHAGRVKIRRALNLLAECRRTNTWPGYPVEIQTLEIKPWSL